MKVPVPQPHPSASPAAIETDPGIVADLIAHNRSSVATLRREIETYSGTALFEFILTDIAELRRILFDSRSHQAIMAGMEATWWLDDHLEEWLGEKNAAGALIQSVPHNITAEMGLALLDVADTIRPHAEVVAFLHSVVESGREDFLDEMAGLPGGRWPRMPSGISSTSTACAAPGRSTSPEHDGASGPPRSCPRFLAISRTSSRAPVHNASRRGFPIRGRRHRIC